MTSEKKLLLLQKRLRSDIKYKDERSVVAAGRTLRSYKQGPAYTKNRSYDKYVTNFLANNFVQLSSAGKQEDDTFVPSFNWKRYSTYE